MSPNGGAVLSIVSARGGAQLVVSGLYGSVQRLDAETLAPKSEQSEYFTGWLTSIYADPEVDTFAMVTSATGRDVTVNEDQREDRLLLIDAASEQTMHDLELSFDGEHADISPDGARVAVTGDGGQVGVIDPSGRTATPITWHRVAAPTASRLVVPTICSDHLAPSNPSSRSAAATSRRRVSTCGLCVTPGSCTLRRVAT